MTQLLDNLDDVMFTLLKQFNMEEKYGEKPKTVKMMVTAARELALKVILPTNKIGDEQGVHFENGKVTLPPEMHNVWGALAEGGWIAMTEDIELGGGDLTHLLATACATWMTGANFSFMMYPGLAAGAGRLIEKHGVLGLSVDSWRTLIQKLYDGTYGGTMCLTEPQAGSDVGALTTTATRNPDGTFIITGSKIFITNGEHDLTSNIIYPVLARIDGAPAGTKGISLFMVPKYMLGTSLPNHVKCTGVEKKMGIHGNGTCTMAFDGSQGWLIGKENKGMSIMFSMMNEARHMVAMQGYATAAAAYMYAVDYAKTRIQGRKIEDFANPEAEAVTIINHPDVRRMLMTMKSYVEGMRSMIYYIAYCQDMAEEFDPQNAKWQGLVDLLTPVTKAFCTEKAFEVCSMAMQVFGGVGYTKEYPIEQLLRDVRITSIYEGTTGIQAMDFLFRQIAKNNGTNVQYLLDAIKETIGDASVKHSSEGGYLKAVLDDLTVHLFTLMTNGVSSMAVHATSVTDIVGHILVGWHLLWRANLGREKDELTLRFYFDNIMPVVRAKIAVLGISNISPLEMKEEDFAGK